MNLLEENYSEAGYMVIGFTCKQCNYRNDYQVARGYLFLAKVVTLMAFIPLLTGSDGNLRTQVSTVVINGMNTDEMRSQLWGLICYKSD
jgi:hypothetical protein